MKILVAEDNQFFCRLLENTLKAWGYEVILAHDGEAAWQVLQKDDHPKVAIVDWMMPRLDGPALCRKIRAFPNPEPVYIILLTAKEGKENVIAGLKAGADDYICKPFDLDELRARLQVGLRIVELQACLADRVRELELALSGAQKLEAIGRLAGGVAHDFNNLLTVILGGTEILLASALSPNQRDIVSMIKDSGERGAGLTRQLLTFSRKQVLKAEVFGLNALVMNLKKLLHRLIGEDVQLETRLDPELWNIRADPGQVEQVIMNLVINARDAMPQGGKLLIETRNIEGKGSDNGSPRNLAAGPHVLLQVTDSGCGMDDYVKARLFEPFFTTKEKGKGTGLGLAMVYGIVNQSGGQILVESQPGKGSIFKILLPRSDADSTSSSNPGLPRPAKQGNQETILLVEDEDSVRVMARQALQLSNYTVLEARDGMEACQVSEQWNEPIHLMLTDVVMPQVNGRQLADRLLPVRPAMKVLFMSGYTDDVIVNHSVLGSGQAFLQKPFTPKVLTSKVREVLDN